MNRGDFLCPIALLVALAGCGPSPHEEDPTELWDDMASEAEIAPLPDFRSYVVGEVPGPSRTRDPFDSRQYVGRPRTAAESSEPGRLELKGIMESKGRLVALLGGESVGEGDTILGWTVVHVDAKSVVLAKGIQTKRLSL